MNPYDPEDIYTPIDTHRAIYGEYIALWAAVVKQAINDIHYGLKHKWSTHHSPENEDGRAFRSAWRWVFNWDDSGKGSLSWVCSYLDINPDQVKKAALNKGTR